MTDATRGIQELEQGNTYRYLWIEEREGLQHQQLKEELQQEYRRRLRMILKWELNAQLNYSYRSISCTGTGVQFGTISWGIEELKQTDRKTRKMLTMYEMHHPKGDIESLYVKRKAGGGGLMEGEAAYKAEIINIAECLNTNYTKISACKHCQIHENPKPAMNSVTRLAAKIMEELGPLRGAFKF